MQDASAVVSSELIGLLQTEDKARLMCSLRPARSAWLVAWPMHLVQYEHKCFLLPSVVAEHPRRLQAHRPHDHHRAVKHLPTEPSRSWPYNLWIDQEITCGVAL